MTKNMHTIFGVFAGILFSAVISFSWASDIEHEAPIISEVQAETIGTVEPEALISEELSEALIVEIDMDMPNHPLIDMYYKQYTTQNGKKWLEAIMQRGEPYISYIQERIAYYGLPECLQYIPVIESDFITTAVSKSGATGLWQFMKNSIAPFNIRINDWIDERRDPWLTTDAALRKLKENYDYFGDWHLALAAYNAGLGAVSRAVKSAGVSDYWYLADNGFLKKETVEYVPKFLAIASILVNSDTHGLTLTCGNTFGDFTLIDVQRPIDMSVLAAEAEIDADKLRNLNPALYYNITPPELRYALRIPSESEERVKAVIANPDALLINYYLYNIKTGDTFYALSRHYGIPVKMLQEYNPSVKPASLQLGQKIIIPAFKEVKPYIGKRDAETIVFNGAHVVQKGETLWSISLLYTIQVETLAEKNNLDVNSTLRVGMSLKVPILE